MINRSIASISIMPTEHKIKRKVPTKPEECDGGGPAKKQARPSAVDEYAKRNYYNYVTPQDQAVSAATSPIGGERQRVVCGQEYVVTPMIEVGCTVNEIDSALLDYKKMPAEEQAAVARRKNDKGGCIRYGAAGGVCWRHGAKVTKQICIIEGCTNQARGGGVCGRHGAKPKCSHEGCSSLAKKGGVCWRHGANNVKRCSQEGCNNYAQYGGVCWRHGAKKGGVCPKELNKSNSRSAVPEEKLRSFASPVSELEGQLVNAKEDLAREAMSENWKMSCRDVLQERHSKTRLRRIAAEKLCIATEALAQRKQLEEDEISRRLATEALVQQALIKMISEKAAGAAAMIVPPMMPHPLLQDGLLTGKVSASNVPSEYSAGCTAIEECGHCSNAYQTSFR